MSFLLHSNVPEVIDIKSAKKKQNEIKTLTSTFIKLLHNWSQVTSQIDALLHNLSILISTVESVKRMECRYPQRFPLFEELFTDTYSMLTGRIYSEIETVYHQLKHYTIKLGDVAVAMRMMEGEVSSSMKNENADVFKVEGVDIIFKPDHILDIQQLICQYLLEYERKNEIVKRVISCTATPPSTIDSTDENNSIVNDDEDETLPWLNSESIDEVISKWIDDCDNSYIDIEQGREMN